MMIPIFILYGALSFANPGVLEHVAENRAAGITAHTITQDWAAYDVLLAVEGCQYVGSTGRLYLDDGRVFSAIVVDCQADEHRKAASLTSLGLLADVNIWDLVHHKAIFLIERGKNRETGYGNPTERKTCQ